MIPVSLHDRSHLTTQIDAREAIRRTIARAQRAELLGYHRFWTAEHHGVPGVAGSSPAVIVGALAAATTSIRVGSGGVMIPNHQPLVIAEQFSTLAALYPDRIDLGIGRSLGFVRPVRAALRRDEYSIEMMISDIAELKSYLEGTAAVDLMPMPVLIPTFILATGAGIEVAAGAGLPLVIGGPQVLKRDDRGALATDRYRDAFVPSSFATEPYVVLNVNAIAAESNAADLALSEAWAHVDSKIAGAFRPLEAPETIKVKSLTARQEERMRSIASGAITGTAGEVIGRILDMVDEIGAEEVMLSSAVFDQDAVLESDELLAREFGLG